MKFVVSSKCLLQPERGYCAGRYYRVLTMVYNTQRYWVFGLCPSSGFFLNNSEKTQRFGNWICFRNIVFFHCYLGKIRMMDKVRKPNISAYCAALMKHISVGVSLTTYCV
jgi:hypothetical protein